MVRKATSRSAGAAKKSRAGAKTRTRTSSRTATTTAKKTASARPRKSAAKTARPKTAPKTVATKKEAHAKRRGPGSVSIREREVSLENLITMVSEEVLEARDHAVEQAKFDIGVKHVYPPTTYELPQDYGVNRVILLVVEPRFVFAYWEVTHEALADNAHHIGNNPKLNLRFYDTTEGAPLDECPTWDIEVFDRLGNWYLRLEHPEQLLVIEVGLKDDAGNFHPIARSNYVRLPQETLAPPGPIRWMIVGPNGEKVITEVEEYTEADHELLRRLLGPHFYNLLLKGEFSSILGSSMEAIFQDISSFKYPESLPSSSPSTWQADSSTK